MTNRPTNASGLVPVEYYTVVELDPQEEKTAGGIILVQQTQDADKISAQEGTLVAISPLAFNYDSWPDDSPKPRVGDRVMFKRFDGHLHEREVGGVKRVFKLLNDKSIIAIVEPPAELRAVA
jgi:co-chaperonin GroES (HSP10)